MTQRSVAQRIVVLAGDGVGPEVTSQAVRVLKAVAERHDLDLSFDDQLLGGAAYDATGKPLPDATLSGPQPALAR